MYFLLFTIFYVYLFFFCLQKKNLPFIKTWYSLDPDERIIAVTITLYIPILLSILIVSDTSDGYQNIFSIMMQFSGITLATVAAIIAYKNYRRKSGDQFSYAIEQAKTNLIILRNDKDKSISLFAIDIVLISGQRIRLVNFLRPHLKPLNLSAFETTNIPLGKVHLYENIPSESFNLNEIVEFICITANGPKKADKLSLSFLDDDFQKENNILLALRVKNTPKLYDREFIDPKAEFWLHLIRDIHDYNYKDIINYVLTGFIENKKFFLTKESLKYLDQQYISLKNHCINTYHDKEVVGPYTSLTHEYADRQNPNYLVNGLFWEENIYSDLSPNEHHDVFTLKEIEKIKIDNGP